MRETRRVEKGWGHEEWIVNGPAYCGKKLVIRKGMRGSWHYHKVKDETFYVQSGLLELLYGDTDSITESCMRVLRPGDSARVPPGMRHQLIAVEDAEVFEFSTQHLDEDTYRVLRGD